MTVEQTPVPLQSQRSQEKSDDFAKIREVTGINDYQRISRAIKDCLNNNGTYEINEVINVLITEESGPTVAATVVPVAETNREDPVGREDKGTNVTPPSTEMVIDLTQGEGGEKEQLRKAIAESLRDTPGILGGQITREEQEISRVLEQSLEESKSGTKRKRGDLWFVDPLNPHERQRQDLWPVGLKNVGNTCWFSAVIQSLFHLAIFRKLVLQSVLPPKAEGGMAQMTLRFMHELSRLFALLVGTQRKYVDPSKAVEILKEAFSADAGSADSQQDVSEFQHKLLDWLEDAFRDSPCPESLQDGACGSSDGVKKELGNPMVKLFYGQYLAEGINEGKSFTIKETFGQFPLQVDGFRDIHESLEAATAQGEIETVSTDVTSKSGQELWFTRLPPVLTFELSRFQFNQHLGRPEKIHNKLQFPELIYMDRYMECNTHITRVKREQVKQLKEQLRLLQQKLDKFVNYGSGVKRFPLQEVLQYALEFAESKPDCIDSPTVGSGGDNTEYIPIQDVEMESPKSQASMATDSPVGTPPKSQLLPDVTMATTPPQQRRRSHETEQSDGRPSPKQVTMEELDVLQGCLRRWREEVEADVRDLQEQISGLETAVGNMYSDDQLQKYPYQLHAVLVHEGQAVSGHYWAYIKSRRQDKWLKFNDITVTEATWEELQHESVGGYHNTSAYCLMYVDNNNDQLLDDSDLGELKVALDQLPGELQKYVTEDNVTFEREMSDWDAEMQRRKDTQAAKLHDSASQQPLSTTDQHLMLPVAEMGTQTQAVLSHAQQHAHLFFRDTCSLVTKVTDSEIFRTNGASDALSRVLAGELEAQQAVAQSVPEALPKKDARLRSMIVYLLVNGAPRDSVVRRVMLEHISQLTKLDSDDSAKKVRLCASDEVERLKQSLQNNDEQSFQEWHQAYSQYLSVASYFVMGVNEFSQERYVDALPYLAYACDKNDSLTEEGRHPLKGFDVPLLRYFRRQCLLYLNEAATHLFEVNDHSSLCECLDIMNKLVLPCLSALSSALLDQSSIEDIREKWCLFLNQELGDYRIEKLQDFLSRLLEPPAEVKSVYSGLSLETPGTMDLAARYNTVIDWATQHGDLQAATKEK